MFATLLQCGAVIGCLSLRVGQDGSGGRERGWARQGWAGCASARIPISVSTGFIFLCIYLSIFLSITYLAIGQHRHLDLSIDDVYMYR